MSLLGRSVKTTWINNSTDDLTLVFQSITEGEWDPAPPITIPANRTAEFEAKYSEGVVGLASYKVPGVGCVTWNFDDPSFGSNNFAVKAYGDLKAEYSNESGDNATPTVTVSNAAVKKPQPEYKAITPVMKQIDTVVHLMLENRSLDNLLGWLYGSDKPANCIPNTFTNFDGASLSHSNIAGSNTYFQSNGTGSAIVLPNGENKTVEMAYPLRIPGFDPFEPMVNVRKQLYNSSNGDWSLTPDMSGFASDYGSALGITHPSQVMGSYNPTQLPIINGLAKNYAVSDRWFCSAPTQTDPNRAFSICGTSMGAEANDDIDESTYADATTIFNALGSNGKSSGMYWSTDDPLGSGTASNEDGFSETLSISWSPYSSYFFPNLNYAPENKVGTFNNFLSDLCNGTLPNFCYLEPYWGGGAGGLDDNDSEFIGIQGNDYHPPAWVGPGENFLNELYNAIIKSPQWENMLFVITFDEHGGTYDHVPPGKTVAPDSHTGKSGFSFDRLGVRVPTILISPYIESQTVFRAEGESSYDHTSMLATLLKWAGVDPGSAGLGARTAQAPTFEGVLSDKRRDDYKSPPTFTVPDGYATQGGGVSAFNNIPLVKPIANSKPVNWSDFRKTCDNSASHEELVKNVNGLLSRK